MSCHLKKAVKEMKWWMYLPFACVSKTMVRWVFEPNEFVDRGWRYIVLMFNMFATATIICLVAGLLGVFNGPTP